MKLRDDPREAITKETTTCYLSNPTEEFVTSVLEGRSHP